MTDDISTRLFHHGTIETLDPSVGRTDALLVRDGRVVAHGKTARDEAGDADAVDLRGGFAMPGLIDAHNHHWLAGQIELFEVDVAPTATLDDFLLAVQRYAAEQPRDAWIVGGSWGSGLLTEIDRPETLARLDAACGGRPALLRDDSKHNRWASPQALRRAGIEQDTPDPAGGRIFRDADGRPTGLLLEAAGILVEHAHEAHDPTSTERLAASSERAIATLHELGVTGFQDAAASLPLLHALRALDDAGRLSAWVVTSMLANDFIFGADPVGEPIIAERDLTASSYHRPTFIKIFLDGVPPSRTGAFLEPYLADACGHRARGEPTMRQDELEAWMRHAATRGLGAKVHCTGDASVRMVLDAAQRLRAEGFARARWHVAHGQFVDPVDIPRFAELDVTAEISPMLWHPGVIPDAIASVLPSERAWRMQPNRSLLDAGARIVAGSDWPVSESPAVWPGVASLVTREDPSGAMSGALWPEQAISLDEAIRCYTVDSAAALGIDDVAGSLAQGRSGDLVALSVDPWSVDIREVARIETVGTWFEGRQVVG